MNTQVKPDAIAFNCVLDVCVKANDLARARRLVQEMKDRIEAFTREKREQVTSSKEAKKSFLDISLSLLERKHKHE